MASMKALAAIALTMVIVCPIALGYVLAIDEEDAVGWETTDQTNISNALLNHTSPYYMAFSSPSNNKELLVRETWQGASIWTTQAPVFNSVGSTVTSQPEYGSVSGTYSLPSLNTTSYVLSTSVSSVGTYGDETRAAPVADRYFVRCEGSWMGPHVEVFLGGIYLVEPGATFTLVRNGASTWSATSSFFDGSVTVSGWSVTTDAACTVSLAYRNYTDLAIAQQEYSFRASEGSGLRLNLAGGGAEYITLSTAAEVVKLNGGVVTINGTSHTGVASIGLLAPFGDSLGYTYVAPTGLYADISAGWKVPAISGPNYPAWYNGQLNGAVTFMVHLEKGADANFTPGSATQLVIHSNSITGVVTVGGQTLGTYSYLQVKITEDGYEVSGLKAWPAYGAPANTLNTVTVPATVPTFDRVSLNLSGTVDLRVDAAEILAGTYPSTLDYTLDLNALFPGDLMAVSLNSIGVYGDSLSIGSTAYPVTNGKITVDGKQVALKGALISFIPDETGQLIGTIGGREVGSFATVPSITFGGEWSLTSIAYKVEETTTTNMSWHAGEFGLDKAGFVAAGLIFAGIAFVVLGMNGRASGAKVGLLMLICGGAAAAYIIIL